MFSDIDETVVVVGFGPGDGRLSSGPRLASSAESSSFSSNINCRSSSSSARDASGEKAIPRLVNSSNISFRLLGDGGVGVDDEEVPAAAERGGERLEVQPRNWVGVGAGRDRPDLLHAPGDREDQHGHGHQLHRTKTLYFKTDARSPIEF